MKVLFMGSPDFAAVALQALVDAGHEIVLAVTQPDREKGRSKELQFTPVKECALKNGIEVFQPLKIKTSESIEFIRKYEADVYVVAAFGQILSQEILDIPRLGCINIHASLLPKYRGAAPIQWSILNGEKETGVTIMQMNAGIDTGNIFMQKKVVIEDTDTGESLFDKLAQCGAEAIVESLPLIESGDLKSVPQKEEDSTYVGMLGKDMGNIDWSWDACKIERYVRGLNSWPSAYTFLNGKTLKIWESSVSSVDTKASDKKPGEIIKIGKDSIDVRCGRGVLTITQLQLEGKKRMAVGDFLRGYAIETGTTFSNKKTTTF